MKYELNDKLKNEIFSLLEQGRKTDPKCERFGAKKHQYKLNPVISIEELDSILESSNFTIPDDYYWFITNVGNGGAGPAYGIYGINGKYTLAQLPVNHITQEECDAINEDDVSDEEYDAFCDKAFSGMIPLSHEGCSGYVYLIVQGDDFGKIIYMDEDFFGAPSFPTAIKPNTFMEWYMGWLHEIALGYKASSYGYAVNGSIEEIYEKFTKETDNDERIHLLYGMKKGKGIEVSQFMQPSATEVLKLSEDVIEGLKQTALKDHCNEVASAAANVMMHYGCDGWREVVRFQLSHNSIGVNMHLLFQLKSLCEYKFKFYPEVDEWYDDLLELVLRSVRSGEVKNDDSHSAYRTAINMVMHSSKYNFDDIKEFLLSDEWDIMEPVLNYCSELPIQKEWETFYFEFTQNQIVEFLHCKNHTKKDCAHLRAALFLTRDVPKNASKGCAQRYYEYIKDDLKALSDYFEANDLMDVDECIASNCQRVYEWLEIKQR